MSALKKIAAHLDRYLKTDSIADWPNARNGLQVENSGAVKKIGAAVDACEFSIHKAVERGIDLLLVHHGLFWSGLQPITDANFRKIKIALDHDLAIYSAHLRSICIRSSATTRCFARRLDSRKPSRFFSRKDSSSD